MAVSRPGPGLSGPAFPERDLLPARRPGLALLSLARDSRPQGSPLSSCPACPPSSLDALGPGTTNASLPFRLAPSPGGDSSKLLLALAEVSWSEEGPVFTAPE